MNSGEGFGLGDAAHLFHKKKLAAQKLNLGTKCLWHSGRRLQESSAEATDKVTAADAELDALPVGLFGHSFLQRPFFPQSLQLDSKILCWRDLRDPFPLPLPFDDFPQPLRMGQNPRERNFSLNFFRASTYEVYAVERSSSAWSNSDAAAS